MAAIADQSIKDKHVHPKANVARTKLAQRVDAIDSIPLERCRVWDARQTNLPATPATDDLGYVTGTLGTDFPSVQTGDVKALGTTTRRLGLTIPIPEDYEDKESLTLRLVAGMKTTVADTSAVIDVEAYLSSEDGTVSADLCTTAAQSINSTTAADKDFTLTATNVEAGGVLDVRITITVVDAASVTAVIGRLLAIKLLSDRR